MTPRDFCYWLHGHLELTQSKTLNKAQLAMIFEDRANSPDKTPGSDKPYYTPPIKREPNPPFQFPVIDGPTVFPTIREDDGPTLTPDRLIC